MTLSQYTLLLPKNNIFVRNYQMTIDEMYDEYLDLQGKMNSGRYEKNELKEMNMQLLKKATEIAFKLGDRAHLMIDGSVLTHYGNVIQRHEIIKTKQIEARIFKIPDQDNFTLYLPKDGDIKDIIEGYLVVEGDYSTTEPINFLTLLANNFISLTYSSYCGSFLRKGIIFLLYKETK